MTHRGLLAGLVAFLAVGFADPLVAVDGVATKAYADGVRPTKVRYKRPGARRPCTLQVRGGYHSYGRGFVSCEWARRMFTPMYDLQSPAGPFDSGFFFDSGLRPHWWNNAPYPN